MLTVPPRKYKSDIAAPKRHPLHSVTLVVVRVVAQHSVAELELKKLKAGSHADQAGVVMVRVDVAIIGDGVVLASLEVGSAAEIWGSLGSELAG
jgi:hypothetical protein